MPSSRSLCLPFEVQAMHQMWKERLTVLKQCMVSNESLGLTTHGFDILIWVPQLLTVWFTLFAHSSVLLKLATSKSSQEDRDSPSHVSQTSLTGVSGCTCPPSLPITDCHPTPGFGLQGQCLSPACLHVPYIFPMRRQWQRNLALPDQPQ